MINHLKNDIYCRLAPSTINGIGVFAIRDIPKGTNPFKTLNPNKDDIITITPNELKKEGINENTIKLCKDVFGGFEPRECDIYHYGPNDINIMFYMNHSTNNNIDVIELNNSVYYGFITNRDIKTGEELFINYDHYNNN